MSFSKVRYDVDMVNLDKIIKDQYSNFTINNINIKFPKWQRNDNWNKKYKESLISSILSGIDIPKFYIADYNSNNYIIDGGHRIRAITGYKNNEFGIHINDKLIFYSGDSHNRHESLTNSERNLFDNYKICIITYKNINEAKAREIFNVLQHQRPMSVAEIVNNIASPIVEFLREEINLQLNNGKTLEENLKKMACSSFKKTENHEYILNLFTVYVIVNPHIFKSKDSLYKEAMSHCSISKDKGIEDSICKLTEELNPLDINKFRDMIEVLLYIDNEFSIYKLPRVELLSIAHYFNYDYKKTKEDFCREFRKFYEDNKDYKKLDSEHNKESKKRPLNQVKINKLSSEMDILNKNKMFDRLWKARHAGTKVEQGMVARLNIFKEYYKNFCENI